MPVRRLWMRYLPSSNPNDRLIVVRVYMRTAKHRAQTTNMMVYIAIFAAVWVGGSTKLTVWPAGAGLMPTCCPEVDMISVIVWSGRSSQCWTCRKNFIKLRQQEGGLKRSKMIRLDNERREFCVCEQGKQKRESSAEVEQKWYMDDRYWDSSIRHMQSLGSCSTDSSVCARLLIARICPVTSSHTLS